MPIVEPDLVLAGTYTLEDAVELNVRVLNTLFASMAEHGVHLEGSILKARPPSRPVSSRPIPSRPIPSRPIPSHPIPRRVPWGAPSRRRADPPTAELRTPAPNATNPNPNTRCLCALAPTLCPGPFRGSPGEHGQRRAVVPGGSVLGAADRRRQPSRAPSLAARRVSHRQLPLRWTGARGRRVVAARDLHAAGMHPPRNRPLPPGAEPRRRRSSAQRDQCGQGRPRRGPLRAVEPLVLLVGRRAGLSRPRRPQSRRHSHVAAIQPP